MLPRMRWRDARVDEPKAEALAVALNLAVPVARALASRGVVEQAQAEMFLYPDLARDLSHPYALPGARAAAERIWEATRAGREIVVFGDFDADGVAATATLITALRRIGARADPFLPEREPEGYGLTAAAIERMLRERGGPPGLLVTVDCGMGAVAETAYLKRLGVEVVITDHHEPDRELPDAAAIVNPRLGGAPESLAFLCGAGVAFKVAHAVAELGRERGWHRGASFCGELLASVGVATVADIVPLVGENRLLVSSALRHWRRLAGEGLRALLARAAQQASEPDAFTFGYVLGPRINAAGRMDSATMAYELLTTQDAGRAVELAARLEGLNGERRGAEARLVAAAMRQAGMTEGGAFAGAAVVVGGDGPHVGAEGWHPGVLGIAAARLSDATGRPAAVVAFDSAGAGRGSARAGAGYHALNALAAAAEALEGYGGHARAAGFRVKPGAFERFRAQFCAACAAQNIGGPPECVVDAWLSPGEISLDLYEQQQRLAPFGAGNPTPCWGARDATLERVQPVGQAGEHLQLAFRVGNQTHRGVWFRQGALAEELRRDGRRCDVLFELASNRFQGETTVEWRVVDLAPAGSGP